MSSPPPPTPPQFAPPQTRVYHSAAERREAVDPSAWPGATLIAFFLGWLALSAVIISTDLIEAPARGVFFRLCLLATPFALAAGVSGIVVLVQRHGRIHAAEIQRADSMREPRI